MKEMVDRVKQLQMSLPLCVICKEMKDHEQVEERLINGFNNIVHPKCFELKKYTLSCGHDHTLDRLREMLELNFEDFSKWEDLHK